MSIFVDHITDSWVRRSPTLALQSDGLYWKATLEVSTTITIDGAIEQYFFCGNDPDPSTAVYQALREYDRNVTVLPDPNEDGPE